MIDIPLITRTSILNKCQFQWVEALQEALGFELVFYGCSLNKGCGNNCSYCWVKYKYENHNYKSWGPKSGEFHKIEFCKNALELIAKELPSLPENAVIIASNLTDPFQDIFFKDSVYFKVFKQWIKLLENTRVLFITKNAKIFNYLEFFNPEKHIIGVSLTGRLTAEEKKKYEPNASYHLARVAVLCKARRLGFKIFASVEPPLKPTPEIIRDFITYNLKGAIIVCGLANYDLENLWTKNDYLRFYDETMLLKEKLGLNLYWKQDALEKINKWRDQDQ